MYGSSARAMQGMSNTLDRSCSSSVPVRMLMSVEEDEEGGASDCCTDCDGPGWGDGAEPEIADEEHDKVAACFASGWLRKFMPRQPPALSPHRTCFRQHDHPRDTRRHLPHVWRRLLGATSAAVGSVRKTKPDFNTPTAMCQQSRFVFITPLSQGLGAVLSRVLGSWTGCHVYWMPIVRDALLHVGGRTWWSRWPAAVRATV